MKAVYYKLDQPLPARHWYKRSIGWFGKTVMGMVIISLVGGISYSYIQNKNTVQGLTAQTATPNKLNNAASTLNTGEVENIIDIQYILDRWEKQHPGEKWSVVAKSIEGPSFEAQLHADTEYDSPSAQKLLLLLPLFSQIPTEHLSRVPLEDQGKTMGACVQLMIRLSDGGCAESVSSFIDFGKAHDSFAKLGMKKTSVNKVTATTTASDTAKLLRALNGDALEKHARDQVLRLLREQYFRSGIPAACPGCVTGNKTYPDDPVAHDLAIVNYSGGSYVLAIFSKDGTLQQINDLAGRIQQKILDTTLD